MPEVTNLNQPILITGGTGFVGSHLLEYLQTLGYRQIHLTSYNPPDQWFLDRLPASNIHQLDLTDQAKTKQLLNKLHPVEIYHLASIAVVGGSFDSLSKILDNNIKLQLSLLTAVKELQLSSRVLIVGSADEYGVSYPDELPMNELHPFRPVNPYAVSKITQDMLAYVYFKAYGLDIVRARPFAHIGERQSDAFSVASFAKQIVLVEKGKQKSLKVGNLEAYRDFTDVKDVVKAYHLLMTQGESGEVYNIGSGQKIKMSQLLNELIALAQVPIKVEVDQARLRPADIDVMLADIQKIKNLGWQPEISLKETLKRVLNYWRETL